MRVRVLLANNDSIVEVSLAKVDIIATGAV
jgi:hypothetical protein